MSVDFKELALKYMQKELIRLNGIIRLYQSDVDELGGKSCYLSSLHYHIRLKVALLKDMKVLQA